MLVNQRTAGPFSPHPRLFTKRKLDLKRGDNFLRNAILKSENVVYSAVVPIGPQLMSVKTVDQLRRYPNSIANLADAALST